jgi:hypothetical protein
VLLNSVHQPCWLNRIFFCHYLQIALTSELGNHIFHCYVTVIFLPEINSSVNLKYTPVTCAFFSSKNGLRNDTELLLQHYWGLMLKLMMMKLLFRNSDYALTVLIRTLYYKDQDVMTHNVVIQQQQK